MQYRTYRDTIISLLVAYFLIGVLLFRVSPGQNEVYPFFAWTLFRDVPHRESVRYVVRVTAVDNVPLEQPIFLDESEGIVKASTGVTNDSRISQLRSAVLVGDAEAIRAAREQLEETFVPKSVGYELVELHLNPIEFWKTGTYTNLRTYGAFTSGVY